MRTVADIARHVEILGSGALGRMLMLMMSVAVARLLGPWQRACNGQLYARRQQEDMKIGGATSARLLLLNCLKVAPVLLYYR